MEAHKKLFKRQHLVLADSEHIGDKHLYCHQTKTKGEIKDEQMENHLVSYQKDWNAKIIKMFLYNWTNLLMGLLNLNKGLKA